MRNRGQSLLGDTEKNTQSLGGNVPPGFSSPRRLTVLPIRMVCSTRLRMMLSSTSYAPTRDKTRNFKLLCARGMYMMIMIMMIDEDDDDD